MVAIKISRRHSYGLLYCTIVVCCCAGDFKYRGLSKLVGHRKLTVLPKASVDDTHPGIRRIRAWVRGASAVHADLGV